MQKCWKARCLKICHADEIDTLRLTNQYKYLEQQQIDFTIVTNGLENINTETNRKSRK